MKGSKAYRLAMKTLGFKQEGANVRININDDYDDLIRCDKLKGEIHVKTTK